MVWELTRALSGTTSDPVAAHLAVGLKVTVIVQVAFGMRVVPEQGLAVLEKPAPETAECQK